MVLSVPCGQTAEIVADGVEDGYFLRVDILLDLRLRIALADLLALGSQHDAVQRLLRQYAIVTQLSVGRPDSKLHLPVQHVATEKVVIIQKLLDCEHSQF